MGDGEDAWTWEFTQKGRKDLEKLDESPREQVLKKLEEICTSPWREPPEYGEPLANSPYRKIRIGQYRLSVSFDREAQILTVHRIKPRSGAYTADDD